MPPAVRCVNRLNTPSTPARARSISFIRPRIAVTPNEARVEAIVQRAIDELKAAADRINALEVRALSQAGRQAGSCACLTRGWGLADGRVENGRFATVRPPAA